MKEKIEKNEKKYASNISKLIERLNLCWISCDEVQFYLSFKKIDRFSVFGHLENPVGINKWNYFAFKSSHSIKIDNYENTIISLRLETKYGLTLRKVNKTPKCATKIHFSRNLRIFESNTCRRTKFFTDIKILSTDYILSEDSSLQPNWYIKYENLLLWPFV